MSALGHKQTYAVQQPMSALPPIATAKADFRTTSCPLYPRKRTFAVHRRMSALGQKRTLSRMECRQKAGRRRSNLFLGIDKFECLGERLPPLRNPGLLIDMTIEPIRFRRTKSINNLVVSGPIHFYIVRIVRSVFRDHRL